jgi:hypothetical protein
VPTLVHIYPLSKLVHALPGDWERDIRLLETGKLWAYAYYQPLREAVVLYCKAHGKRYEESLKLLETRAHSVPAGRGADPVRDNKAAFNVFVEHFYPRMGKFVKSLLQTDAKGGCKFAGVQLLGMPQFVTTDKAGRERYVFLLASKWKKDDLKAYLELLAVIIAERFGAAPESIWCMDLRSGTDGQWRSSARVRGRCEKAAVLYARFIQLMSSPG